MDPRKLFVDQRFTGYCVYCGGPPRTRDHCPSKVLLDEPLPSNLPVVEACSDCNGGFSMDEQYFACMIECAMRGTAEASEVCRPKVARMLHENPLLASKIRQSMSINSSGRKYWQPEAERVRRILLKLAAGHLAFELGLPCRGEPDTLWLRPFEEMFEPEREEFENPDEGGVALWPELGSRKFIRVFEGGSSGWTVVQPERYRYLVGQAPDDFVHIAFSEYLACRVSWS